MNIHRSIVLAALLGSFVMTPKASAAPGWSWNLSRDMILDENFGPNSNPLSPASWWTFMGTSNAIPTAMCNGVTPNYTALPNYTPLNYWGPGSLWDGLDTSQEVGLLMDTTPAAIPLSNGVPYLHPGAKYATAVRWRNPLKAPWQTIKVNVLGRFTHVDPYGSGLADGVNWYVVKVSGCKSKVLNSGFIQSTNWPVANDTGVFLHKGVTVGPNESLYFIVHRNGNYFYDTTELDVLITSM
ncbi:MAG TPA: hypothetical protein VNM90_00155 [Haliangium sp.]|nr:hypothetical protein [Haliangium sp.]